MAIAIFTNSTKFTICRFTICSIPIRIDLLYFQKYKAKYLSIGGSTLDMGSQTTDYYSMAKRYKRAYKLLKPRQLAGASTSEPIPSNSQEPPISPNLMLGDECAAIWDQVYTRGNIEGTPNSNDLSMFTDQSARSKDHFFFGDRMIASLNDIKLIPFQIPGKSSQEEVEGYIINYIYHFCQAIFNNISSKPYVIPAGERYHQDEYSRLNHGGINHLRSIIFSGTMLNFLKQYNMAHYQEIIQDRPDYLVMTLLASMFVSILRVDESSGTPQLVKLSDHNFNLLFPDLDPLIYNCGIPPHQLASSVLYLKISELCFPEAHPLIKNMVCWGISYYYVCNDRSKAN